MENRILIFAGEDETAAADLARKFRAEGRYAMAISAFHYDSAEKCLHLIIMPDVPGWRADIIRREYPGQEMTYFAVTKPVLAVDNEVITMPKRRGRPRKAVIEKGETL